MHLCLQAVAFQRPHSPLASPALLSFLSRLPCLPPPSLFFLCRAFVQGRFAAELSTGDELVLTEMVFAGVFSEMR